MTQANVDVKTIQAKNQATLKAAAEKRNLKWQMGLMPVNGKDEYVLFINPIGHDKKLTALIPAGSWEGVLNVGKGGMLGPGEVVVWGMPNDAKGRTAFTRHIAAFSKKKVTFK
jgi:hypothetical protein